MADHSNIEWTDATWNPTTGCTKVSPGCAHCYIERTAAFRMTRRTFDRHGQIPVTLHDTRLEEPLHWRKPRRVFVNSLSDLFHDDVPDQFLHEVYHTMEAAHWHTFQVLTKRPARMRAYLTWRYGPDAETPRGRIPSRHIWHGVSVENQHVADERIPLLLQTPSAVRFISAEPLLGAIDLRRLNLSVQQTGWGPRLIARDALTPWETQYHGTTETRGRDSVNRGTQLEWVIVGGESGPGARPCDLAWVRSIVAQCRAAGVACFVKQLGARAYGPDTHSAILRDRKGGDPDEWPDDLRVREYPDVRHVGRSGGLPPTTSSADGSGAVLT